MATQKRYRASTISATSDASDHVNDKRPKPPYVGMFGNLTTAHARSRSYDISGLGAAQLNPNQASPLASTVSRLTKRFEESSTATASASESRRPAAPQTTCTPSEPVTNGVSPPTKQPCFKCALYERQIPDIQEQLKQEKANVAALQEKRKKDRREYAERDKKLNEEQRSKEQVNRALVTELETAKKDMAAMQLRYQTELKTAKAEVTAVRHQGDNDCRELESKLHDEQRYGEQLYKDLSSAKSRAKKAADLQRQKTEVQEKLEQAKAEIAAMQRQHDGDRREFERKLFEEQDGKKQLNVDLSSAKSQTRTDVAALQRQKTEVQKKLEQAKTEIATLRRSRHPGRQETEDLRRKLDEENRSKQEMNEALSRAEAQLVASRNEAAALRLFSDEENVDGATVHNHFKDLVTGIDDLVFSVYEKLGEVEVSSPIDIDRNKFGAFAATNPDIANMLWPFLSTIMSTQPTMETVAMPVMHCIASSFLCSYFLQPFYPIAAEFSDPSLYDGLTRLWSGIAERESQEVIGRWRSISYRALRNPQADEDVFFENGAKYLLNYLCHTMVILLPQHLAGSQNWETLVDSLMPRAVKVLRKAVAFQSITQGICVTWDYAIYHPALRGTFLEDTMEVDVDVQGDHPKLLERQPINGSQLLLATSLGLQAHRKTVQSQETIVVQKARVVVLRASKP